MDKKLLAVVLLYPVVVAGVAVYWCQSRFEDELAVRPPIAVIDEATFVAQNLKPGADTQDLEKLLVRTEGAAKVLSDHGYLVLRKQQVFASPDEIEAKP